MKNLTLVEFSYKGRQGEMETFQNMVPIIAKIPVFKKIGIVFLVLTMLCSILPVASAETVEQPLFEVKTELVPLGIEQTDGEVITQPFEVELVNDDVNHTTMEDVVLVTNLSYNVSFEIISIDRGTFDDASIINATHICFNATEIPYGEKRTGKAMIKFNSSSPVTLCSCWYVHLGCCFMILISQRKRKR